MRSFAPTRRVASYIVTGACLLLLLPIAAAAQTSGISGTVNDTSGAVLPGVTVEVASPALIEKVRTATTNSSGRYSITALRPGAVLDHVHAAGLQHRQAREHRADLRLHRDHQR